MIKIDRMDHVVLTVRSITETCSFYERTLGIEIVMFGDNRCALAFGDQKINLHEAGREFEPKADRPTPGSADICFISSTPMSKVLAHLQRLGVPIEQGPVQRTGALGAIQSVYIRDPDANLIEVSNYLD